MLTQCKESTIMTPLRQDKNDKNPAGCPEENLNYSRRKCS